jgi:CelD/BcsL family acetyltransferase involved in cellulose biosynthesis
MDSEITLNTDTTLDGLAHAPAVERRAAGTAVTLDVVQGLEGLTALRDDWAALAQIVTDGRFHHQYAWYLSYLRHLEQDPASVHFFSFYRDGRPAAIFPLRWTQGSVAGIKLRLWELPSHLHMDLCDALIAPEEDGASLIPQLVDALGRRTGRAWDALHLPNLLDDAMALRALRAAPLPRVRLTRTGQSMYFPCADMDTAMRNASKDFKRNLRRQRRKLEQRGHVEVSLTQDREALHEAFSEFLNVEASGWKGGDGRGSAITLHPHLVSFYRDLLAESPPGNRCSINLVKLDGKAIAAQYCLICGKRASLLKIAYDEAFSAEAPGQQLLHEMLAHCCSSAAIDELSLVTGPPWAVGRWNPESHDVWTAHVFNLTPRALVAYTLTRLKALSAGAEKLFKPLPNKQRPSQ